MKNKTELINLKVEEKKNKKTEENTLSHNIKNESDNFNSSF